LPLYKKLFLGREIHDAERVIVLNNEQRRTVRYEHGYDDELLVMSNGIGEDFFHVTRKPAESGTFKLLFVGRLSPHKNLTALLEALSVIKREITLDIIGDGECRRELSALIADKKLENVWLHGRLSRDEVKKFYATCSALILPSLYEAQPIVLLEAMAAGVPVIVTKGIGVDVTAREAVLIEPTVQGIADGIESSAAMAPEARELLVDAAFKRAEEHRWPTLISTYINLYDEIARDMRPPKRLTWSGRNAVESGQRHETDADAS